MTPRMPLVIVVLSIVAGCATDAAVQPNPSQVYLIVAESQTKNLSDLNTHAVRSALNMCQSTGKEMVLLATRIQIQTGSLPQEVTVKYTCSDRKRH